MLMNSLFEGDSAGY